MDEKFDFDSLFGDDTELSELLKNINSENTNSPPTNPLHPDTSGFLDPNELFKSSSQNVQPVQSSDTYMPRPSESRIYGGSNEQPQQPSSSPDLKELLASLRLLEQNGVKAPPDYTPPGASAIAERQPEQIAKPPNLDSILENEIQQEETKKSRTPAKKLLSILSNLVFWLVVISLVGGSILFAVSKNPKKAYFGYRFYSVLTESMSAKADGSSPPGGFDKGDIIIVELCEADAIQEGDVITFCPNINKPDSNAYLTHRVVDILYELDGHEGIFFRTRGDHNDADDPPINGAQLIGKKVLVIPKMGGILQSLRANFILAVATIVCLFGCIFMFKWYFAKPKEKEQQKQ